MSKEKDKPLAKKLCDMKLVLTTIQHEDVKFRFIPYGYNDAVLAEGQRIYQDTLQLIQEKEIADANYRKSVHAMAEASDLAKKYYLKQITLAKVALRNTGTTIHDLGIVGKRKQTFVGWTDEAKSFYLLAMNPKKLVLLEKNGISLDILTMGQQMVLALTGHNSDKIDRKGLAQVATSARDKKCKELYAWYMDFKKVAYLVFGKDSQQLERFGFLVYSPGYKRKKKKKEDSLSYPSA